MVNYFNYFFKHYKLMTHDKVNEVQREMLPEFFLNFFIFVKLLFEQLTVNFDIAWQIIRVSVEIGQVRICKPFKHILQASHFSILS